jgi:hypothetical protein
VITLDGLARLAAPTEGEHGSVLDVFEAKSQAAVEGEEEDGTAYDAGAVCIPALVVSP